MHFKVNLMLFALFFCSALAEKENRLSGSRHLWVQTKLEHIVPKGYVGKFSSLLVSFNFHIIYIFMLKKEIVVKRATGVFDH